MTRLAAARAARRGMTLVEIMVVVAILAMLSLVAIPSLQAIFDVQQRGAVRDLASTYEFLQAEAALRNVCFRVAYNLDANTYQVELGSPDATVWGDSEKMKEYEADRERGFGRFKKNDEAGAPKSDFKKFEIDGIDTEVQLPEGTVFKWVYTPVYETPQTPTEEKDRDDDAGPRMVYSHIFPNGFVEYTAIRVVDEDDMEDGFTLTVQPMSGDVSIDPEEIDPVEAMDWIPDEGPTIR